MASEEDNPYHYSGLHAFGFLERNRVRPSEVVDAMRELGEPPDGPVMWAGTFVGDYAAMVHVRVEQGSVGSLLDLIDDDFWKAGFRGRWAIEARPAEKTAAGGNASRKVGVKRGTQEIIAISSLEVAHGSLGQVLERLPLISTFRGASVVFGDADVLLQLGADAFDDVAASVELELQGIEGVGRTSTAFCDGRR
jgi:hypothetical protein